MKPPARRRARTGLRTAVVAAVLAIPAIAVGACAKDRFPPDDDNSGNPSTTGPGTGGGGVIDENTEALCTDGEDNDGDGCADCLDFGCVNGLTICAPPDPPEPENTLEKCSDGIDNDGDNYVDCSDFDCTGAQASSEAVAYCAQISETNDERCSDGLDNDCNGFIDCNDNSCRKSPTVTVCPKENTQELCSDNMDNDGDSFIDCNDFDCDAFCD
jgi:hypothetical protein